MRAQAVVLFSPEDEEQLDRIVDGICDIMRDEGFAADSTVGPDDEVKSLVIVSPTPDVDIEEMLGSMVKGSYKVAIPSWDRDEDGEPAREAMVIPVGTANEQSEVKR